MHIDAVHNTPHYKEKKAPSEKKVNVIMLDRSSAYCTGKHSLDWLGCRTGSRNGTEDY